MFSKKQTEKIDPQRVHSIEFYINLDFILTSTLPLTRAAHALRFSTHWVCFNLVFRCFALPCKDLAWLCLDLAFPCTALPDPFLYQSRLSFSRKQTPLLFEKPVVEKLLHT